MLSKYEIILRHPEGQEVTFTEKCTSIHEALTLCEPNEERGYEVVSIKKVN